MRRRPRLVSLAPVAVLLALAVSALARGDVVTMKDGRVYRGAVDERDGVVTITLSDRFYRVAKAQVDEIVKESAAASMDWRFVGQPINALDPDRKVKGKLDPVTKFVSTTGLGADGRHTRVVIDPKLGQVEVELAITTLTPSVYTVEGVNYDTRWSYDTASLGSGMVETLLGRVAPTDDPRAQLEVANFLRLAGFPHAADRRLGTVSAGGDVEQAQIDAERAAIGAALTERAQAEARLALRRDDIDGAIRALDGLGDRATDEASAELARIRAERDRRLETRAWVETAAAALDAGILEARLERLAKGLPLPASARIHAAFGEGFDAAAEAGKDATALARRMLLVGRYGDVIPEADLARPDMVARLAEVERWVADYLGTADRKEERELLKKIGKTKGIPLATWAAFARRARRPAPEVDIALVVDRPLKSRVTDHYLMLLPPSYHEAREWPLVVTIHGQTSRAESQPQIWQRESFRRGYILIAPEYQRSKTNFPRYRFSHDEHRAVLEAIEDVCRDFPVDPDRIYLVGHSMGGHMTYDVGLSHPTRFARLGPFIGCPFGVVDPYLDNAGNLPIYCIEGENDGDATNRNRAGTAYCQKAGMDVTYVEYPNRGHEAFSEEFDDLFDWLDLGTRDAFPKKLSIASGRASDDDFYWLRLESWGKGGSSLKGEKSHGADLPSLAWADAEIEDNEVRIKGKGIQKLTVFFAPGMVDFDETVRITVNGKVRWKGKLDPSPVHMLEQVKERGDRGLPFVASQSVKAR